MKWDLVITSPAKRALYKVPRADLKHMELHSPRCAPTPTLGLLLELRKLAKEAADLNNELSGNFQELLRSVSNPNVPDVPKDLPFKVRSFELGSKSVLRTISLNGNIEIARAAFEMAKKLYPWVLLWGSRVVDYTDPPSA
jgi:hypothetical protein